MGLTNFLLNIKRKIDYNTEHSYKKNIYSY